MQDHPLKLTSRRQTLQTLAALATIQIVPGRVLGKIGQTPPSEVLTHGIIGCGFIGGSHLTMPGKLLALCDADEKHLAGKMQRAKEKWKHQDVTGYRDFRELIARKDIDIVHIATPPHWHGYMAVAAAKAGKDVFCEKPMSRTIGEGTEWLLVMHHGQHGHHRPSPEQKPQVRFEDAEVRRPRSERADPPTHARPLANLA